MFLWTVITAGLSLGSYTGSMNARIGLVAWLAASAALYAIGGPAID